MKPEGPFPTGQSKRITGWSSDRNGSGRVLRARTLAALAVLAMVTACGGDDAPAFLVTTSSRVITTAATTTAAPPLTTTTTAITTAADSSTTTAAGEQGADEIFYRVVRQESTRDGRVLYLEISPGDYTDIDLENLVLSVHEEREDLFELHVLDDREAVSALLKSAEDRTSEEAELLESHYLVSFLEGGILRFQGPFADLEGYVVGS